MPPPPTFYPYPPGFIIGGDYDLNPPNLTSALFYFLFQSFWLLKLLVRITAPWCVFFSNLTYMDELISE